MVVEKLLSVNSNGISLQKKANQNAESPVSQSFQKLPEFKFLTTKQYLAMHGTVVGGSPVFMGNSQKDKALRALSDPEAVKAALNDKNPQLLKQVKGLTSEELAKHPEAVKIIITAANDTDTPLKKEIEKFVGTNNTLKDWGRKAVASLAVAILSLAMIAPAKAADSVNPLMSPELNTTQSTTENTYKATGEKNDETPLNVSLFSETSSINLKPSSFVIDDIVVQDVRDSFQDYKTPCEVKYLPTANGFVESKSDSAISLKLAIVSKYIEFGRDANKTWDFLVNDIKSKADNPEQIRNAIVSLQHSLYFNRDKTPENVENVSNHIDLFKAALDAGGAGVVDNFASGAIHDLTRRLLNEAGIDAATMSGVIDPRMGENGKVSSLIYKLGNKYYFNYYDKSYEIPANNIQEAATFVALRSGVYSTNGQLVLQGAEKGQTYTSFLFSDLMLRGDRIDGQSAYNLRQTSQKAFEFLQGLDELSAAKKQLLEDAISDKMTIQYVDFAPSYSTETEFGGSGKLVLMGKTNDDKVRTIELDLGTNNDQQIFETLIKTLNPDKGTVSIWTISSGSMDTKNNSFVDESSDKYNALSWQWQNKNNLLYIRIQKNDLSAKAGTLEDSSKVKLTDNETTSGAFRYYFISNPVKKADFLRWFVNVNRVGYNTETKTDGWTNVWNGEWAPLVTSGQGESWVDSLNLGTMFKKEGDRYKLEGNAYIGKFQTKGIDNDILKREVTITGDQVGAGLKLTYEITPNFNIFANAEAIGMRADHYEQLVFAHLIGLDIKNEARRLGLELSAGQEKAITEIKMTGFNDKRENLLDTLNLKLNFYTKDQKGNFYIGATQIEDNGDKDIQYKVGYKLKF